MNITINHPYQNWAEYTLTNNHGISISFLDYGGIITEITAPDKNGTIENIVLAYEDYQHYTENPNYFGAIIGRTAGRIKDASFTINNVPYQLEKNNGNHNLHGGSEGFHQMVWKTETFQHDGSIGVRLSHISPDQHGGFPGCIHANVTYTLTNDNQFRIDYKAISTKDTVMTLTNHTYFNLTGNLKNTIGNHRLTAPCSTYLPMDEELIPLGMTEKTAESSFDFRCGNPISSGINSEKPQNIIAGNGYDHYFLFDEDKDKKLTVYEPVSGRTLITETTQPGFVFYTANNLEQGLKLKNRESAKHLGFCIETQASPAALNHPNLPSVNLKAEEAYKASTVFTFL